MSCGKAFKRASVKSVSGRNNISVEFQSIVSQYFCGKDIYTQNQVKPYRSVDTVPSLTGILSVYSDIAVKCSGKFKRASISDISFNATALVSFSLEGGFDALTCSIGGAGNYYSLGKLIRDGKLKKY